MNNKQKRKLIYKLIFLKKIICEILYYDETRFVYPCA